MGTFSHVCTQSPTERAVQGGTRESVQNGTLRRAPTPMPAERAVMDGTVIADQTESHVRSGTRASHAMATLKRRQLQCGRNYAAQAARSALDGEFRLYWHDWVCDGVRGVSSTAGTETSVTDANVAILQELSVRNGCGPLLRSLPKKTDLRILSQKNRARLL